MHSHTLLVALAAMASLVRADKIFAVDFDVIASKVGENNGLTTYAVACPAASNTKQCNFVQPYTLVQGPSTVSFAITVPGAQTATLQCTLPASTALSCSATAITPAPTPITIVATSDFTGAGITSYYKDVSLVTASTALLTYSPAGSSSSSGGGGGSSAAANATSSGNFGQIAGAAKSGSAKATGGVGGNGNKSGGGSSGPTSGAMSTSSNVVIMGAVAAAAVLGAWVC